MAKETPEVQSLDHLVLTVADIAATVEFYTRVLGMRATEFIASDGKPRHALSFGAQKINLHPAGSDITPRAARPMPGSADLCFLSPSPAEVWMAHFETLSIEVIAGPVPRAGAQGPIMSVYIRDPDGNLVEVANPVEGSREEA